MRFNIDYSFHGPNWPGDGYYTLLGWCGKAECEPVLCPNDDVCGDPRFSGTPRWYLDCHGSRCQTCNMTFGKDLVFRDTPDECPVCLEGDRKKLGLPFCSHSVCVVCFNVLGKTNIG